MNDVTRLLDAMRSGDAAAGAQILPLVYAELRQLARAKMAREQPGHTLQPTALVHEAWLRLGDQRFENRAHFFGAAAEAMRRILIDSARRRAARCHGGGRVQAGSDDALAAIAAPSVDHTIADADDLLALDAALRKLEAEDKLKADLVKLHYFVGLSLDDAADALGISRATAYRHWTYARAWLRHEITSNKS